MTEPIKVINLEILPVGNTFFGLLREKNNRKENIKKYIDAIATRWETLKEPIATFWTEHHEDYDKLKPMSPETEFEKFLGKFNNEEDLKTKTKPEIIKEIDHILTIHDEDSDTLKELKAVYLDHKAKLSESVNDAEGMTWLIFLVQIIKDFYLITLPQYLETKLKENNVVVKDLKDDWKDIKNNLFLNLYSTDQDLKESKDFKDLLSGIAEQLEKAEKLIIASKKEIVNKVDNKENVELKNDNIAKDKEIQKLKDKLQRILNLSKEHYKKYHGGK